MDALRAADDLLAADEHVERVGVVRVVGARHRVERADALREAVEDVEVGAVLGLDERAQLALELGVEVLERVDVGVATLVECWCMGGVFLLLWRGEWLV